MSIDLASIPAKTRKTRARKAGEQRASQTLYVARFGNEVYKVSRDKNEAREAMEKNGKDPDGVEEFGSRRALPASITLAVFKQSPTLADLYIGLGGRWGTQSQNDANIKAIASHLKEAFDALNMARKMSKKEPIALPSVDPGKWMYVRTTTQKGLDADEVNELNELADEFGDMFDEGDE